MICFPNAKINLGLNVVEKRPDGFHSIESVFYPIGIRDALEVIENRGFKAGNDRIQFSTAGIEIPGSLDGNLCVKAYQLLSKDHSLPPVKAMLLKKIPIGAGLGGGSADGAFFIKLLNDRFELDLKTEKMKLYASQLGSDCPFFIANKPAYVTGRGEIMQEINLDLSQFFITLINPNIHIGTKEAYSSINPKQSETSLKNIISSPIETWKNQVLNDFEAPISKLYPAIKEIKNQLYEGGAIYASMTGSGSTVYGIFKTETKVEVDKSYFTWTGRL